MVDIRQRLRKQGISVSKFSSITEIPYRTLLSLERQELKRVDLSILKKIIDELDVKDEELYQFIFGSK